MLRSLLILFHCWQDCSLSVSKHLTAFVLQVALWRLFQLAPQTADAYVILLFWRLYWSHNLHTCVTFAHICIDLNEECVLKLFLILDFILLELRLDVNLLIWELGGWNGVWIHLASLTFTNKTTLKVTFRSNTLPFGGQVRVRLVTTRLLIATVHCLNKIYFLRIY